MALAVAAGTPLLVRGPGIILDDWYTLNWARTLGRWHAAGPTQPRARPLGAVVYDLQYGVIGAHPTAWIVAQALLLGIAAVLFHRIGRRFLPAPVAAASALVWVVSANHSTLDSWGAGSLAVVALVLLLGGALADLRSTSAPGEGLAMTLLAASPLVYEATLPASLCAAVALPWLSGRRPRLLRLAARVTPAAVAGVWLVSGSYHLEKDQGWFGFASIFEALFGQGVARWKGPSAVTMTVALLTCSLAIAARVSPSAQRLVPPGPARLLGAGIAVAVVGYSAFFRYPITALGIGDRANVVSGLGGALAWTAIGWTLHERRRLLAVTALAFASLLGSARYARGCDWADAGDDSRQILAIVVPQVEAAPPGEVLVAGPPPVGHEGIFGLVGTIEPAVQYVLGDSSRKATVAITDEEWQATPPDRRVDIRSARA
jgi:hypothetical protein